MNICKGYSKMWFLALLLVAVVAGCASNAQESPIIPIIPDTIRPTVSFTAPTAGDLAVPTNRKVYVAFSEVMSPSTITNATFTLSSPGVPIVSGTVSAVSTSAIFSPTNDLASNTTYTGTITTGAKDLAGNALAGNPATPLVASNFVFTFVTGAAAAADTTKPTVSVTSPTNTAVAVPLGRKVTVGFSEVMNPLTITNATFTLSSPSVPIVAGTVSAVGTSAIFTPAINLVSNTTYTGTITTGAKDLAGNALAGNPATPLVASNFVFTFTTGLVADIIAPTVVIVNPANFAIGVSIASSVNATFSEAMDPATLIAAGAFTVTEPIQQALVPGTVTTVGTSAMTFTPTNPLALNTKYTATIKSGISGVKDLAGTSLAVNKVWTFTTEAVVLVPPGPVNLGLAAPFGIAATAGITNIGATTINGDAVLDPNATCNAVAIDTAGGFGLCGGTPPTITGKVISPLFQVVGGPTSTAVKADLTAAFLSITPPAGPPAAGTLPGAIALPAGTTLGAVAGSALVLGDNLFTAGVYQSLTSIMITGDLTLDAQGDPNATFIFQSSQTIGTADGVAGVNTHILLVNGAKASNVFWQAGTSATLGTASVFNGNILASESITMKTGATSCGRLLAGAFAAGAFVFDNNVVSVPGNVNAPSCL